KQVTGRAHIIFDLDGTISDPILGITRSFNYALREYEYPEISAEQLGPAIGPPLDEAFRSFLPSATRQRILDLVAKFRERYGDVGYSENVVYEGIPEILRALATRGV